MSRGVNNLNFKKNTPDAVCVEWIVGRNLGSSCSDPNNVWWWFECGWWW